MRQVCRCLDTVDVFDDDLAHLRSSRMRCGLTRVLVQLDAFVSLLNRQRLLDAHFVDVVAPLHQTIRLLPDLSTPTFLRTDIAVELRRKGIRIRVGLHVRLLFLLLRRLGRLGGWGLCAN